MLTTWTCPACGWENEDIEILTVRPVCGSCGNDWSWEDLHEENVVKIKTEPSTEKEHDNE